MFFTSRDQLSADQEQKEQLLDSGDELDDIEVYRKRRPSGWTFIDILSILGIILAVSVVILSYRYPTDLTCRKKLCTWSPMTEALKFEWRPLSDQSEKMRFSGPPNEELEHAWFKTWAWGATAIQLDDLPKMNKLEVEKNWTMLPMDVGGGVKAHIQVFHYLHCADIMRQFLYWNEWNYTAAPAFRHGETMAREHVEHCIEVLRIELLCIADVTPYPISVSEDGLLGVHANARYKCPNWPMVTAWADENAAIPYDVIAQS